MPSAVSDHSRPSQPFSLNQASAVLLLLVAAWCVLWFVHARGYWEDDAFIHLEFARSVARGHGFAFNGHVVYGDTSPLWVWLLAGMHLLLNSWMVAGKTLAVLGAVFALCGLYQLARQLTRDLGTSPSRVFAASSLLLLVANPYFGYWAFSGMEALAAAGLVCWGVVAAAGVSGRHPIAPHRLLLGSACAGLAPLLRPEMLFFSILLGLPLFVAWVNVPVAAGRKLALFFSSLLLGMAPAVGWAVYAARSFGAFLPNTNAAKRAAPGDSIPRHLLSIYAFGFPVLLIALVSVAWWVYRQRRGGIATALVRVFDSIEPAAWIVLLWSLLNGVFYILNHTYVQTRYVFVTALPLTVVLLAVLRKLWQPLCQIILPAGVVLGILVSLLTTWPLVRNKVAVDREYALRAAFFQTLPPGAPVAHYSIGEAAFLSEHPIVDTGGITRPGIIPFLWDSADNRRIWWIHEQGARYAVEDHQPEPGAVLVWSRDIPATGWSLHPGRYHDTEPLRVWKLPPSPTLPLSPALPEHDEP